MRHWLFASHVTVHDSAALQSSAHDEPALQSIAHEVWPLHANFPVAALALKAHVSWPLHVAWQVEPLVQLVAHAPCACEQSNGGHAQLQPSQVFVTSRSPMFVFDLHAEAGKGVPHALLGSIAAPSLSPPELPPEDELVPLADAAKRASKSFAHAANAIAKPEKARAIAARVIPSE